MTALAAGKSNLDCTGWRLPGSKRRKPNQTIANLATTR